MNKNICLGSLFALLILLVVPVGAIEVNITNFEDTGADSSSPTSINYNLYALEFGRYFWEGMDNKVRRPYFAFPLDIEELSNVSEIESAYLNLYIGYDGSTDVYSVEKYLVAPSVAFNLTSLNWNNQPCGSNIGDVYYINESVTGCSAYDETQTLTTSGGWSVINITEAVSYAYENGYPTAYLMLDHKYSVNNLTVYLWYNSFESVNNHPYITITGIEGGETPIFNRWDDLSSVGDEIGGFFTNFQGGLLSLLLGLIIVGVVGMFFYVVFNIVATSVKEGFKK